MTYEKTLKLSGAILTQMDIVRLMNIISSYSSKVTISVEYKDNSKVNKITVDNFETMSFKNKSIKSMEIHMIETRTDDSISIWLRFDTYYNMYELKYEFSDHNKYLSFSNEIEAWKTEVSDRKRYINILNSPFISILTFVLIFLPISCLLVKHKINLGYAYLLVLASMGVSAIVSFLVKLSFPLTEIDIGNNKHKSTRKVLWGVIVILVIPTILSFMF
jgi:hypothetical protein